MTLKVGRGFEESTETYRVQFAVEDIPTSLAGFRRVITISRMTPAHLRRYLEIVGLSREQCEEEIELLGQANGSGRVFSVASPETFSDLEKFAKQESMPFEMKYVKLDSDH